MGANFNSYYWTIDDLPAGNLREAFERLSSAEATPAEKRQAFGVLLDSDNTAARCIAFNYFFYQSSLWRFGVENVFQDYAEVLLLKARAELSRAPVDGLTAEGERVRGANHASALGVMAHLGEERDLDLLAPVLASSNSRSVLFMGCAAARRCLRDAGNYYPEIVAALSRIAQTTDYPDQLRISAVSAISSSEHEEAETVLATLSRELPFPESAYAAAALAARGVGKYRSLLQHLSDSWPEDAPYPASEVREILEADS